MLNHAHLTSCNDESFALNKKLVFDISSNNIITLDMSKEQGNVEQF